MALAAPAKPTPEAPVQARGVGVHLLAEDLDADGDVVMGETHSDVLHILAICKNKPHSDSMAIHLVEQVVVMHVETPFIGLGEVVMGDC